LVIVFGRVRLICKSDSARAAKITFTGIFLPAVLALNHRFLRKKKENFFLLMLRNIAEKSSLSKPQEKADLILPPQTSQPSRAVRLRVLRQQKNRGLNS